MTQPIAKKISKGSSNVPPVVDRLMQNRDYITSTNIALTYARETHRAKVELAKKHPDQYFDPYR